MDNQKLTIGNFKDFVSPVILERGRRYFKQNRATEFTQISENEFSAFVEGSDIYEVYIKLKGEEKEIISLRCDCPYDLGPVCKHGVAVMYALRQSFLGKKTTQIKKLKKKKSLETIIKNLERKQLEEAVFSFACHNKEFDTFIRRLDTPEDGEDFKDFYKTQITDCIKIAAGKYGYVDYYHAHQAAEAANELTHKVKNLIDKEKFKEATPILQALIEELYAEIENIDDSGGHFSYALNGVWEYLSEITENIDKNSNLGKELFNYLIEQAENPIYDGWCLTYDFYGLAGFLVRNEDDKQILFANLDNDQNDQEGKNSPRKFRDLEQIINIKIDVLKQLEKHKEVEKLIQEYIYLPSVLSHTHTPQKSHI